jgi:hypothetical protein
MSSSESELNQEHQDKSLAEDSLEEIAKQDRNDIHNRINITN